MKRILLPPIVGPHRTHSVRKIFKQTTELGVGRAVMELCTRCRRAQNKGT